MQLLLPSAHTAVLVTDEPGPFEKFKDALFVFGVLMVLCGGLDLARHIPAAQVSDETLKTAFAPAATLGE